MTLNYLRYVFQNMAELYGNTKPLTIDNFNNYLWMADYELLKQVYGNLNKEEGYETKKQITDAIRPFKASVAVPLTTGIGDLGSEYVLDVHTYRYGYGVRRISIGYLTGNMGYRTDVLFDTMAIGLGYMYGFG